MVNVVLIVLMLVVSPSLAVGAKAAEKAEDWQIGNLIDLEIVSEPYLVNATTHYDNYQRFEIETDTHVYSASQRLQGGFVRNGLPGLFMRRTRPAVLTVNGPVKYRLEKNRIVILDENGDEHRLSIVKKAAKRAGSYDDRKERK